MGIAETCSCCYCCCCHCCCDYGYHTYELRQEEGETGEAEGLAVKKKKEESRGKGSTLYPQTPLAGSDSQKGALLLLELDI